MYFTKIGNLFFNTYMVPEVVGTMGMSSASIGIDQGMWNWGANSLITMFLMRQRKAITDLIGLSTSESV